MYLPSKLLKIKPLELEIDRQSRKLRYLFPLAKFPCVSTVTILPNRYDLNTV